MITINGKNYVSESDVHKEHMRDPEFRKRWEAGAPRRALISHLIDMRNAGKITQKQLAAAINTKQPSIARLESGSYNPSLEYAQRVALATGKTFVLRDLPKKHKERKGRKKRQR